MRSLAVVALCTLVAARAVVGQDPGARRFQPPPDHWMTIDSLGEAVGLTADQKTKVAQPYNALNGVMKDAAARRQALRQQMQGSFQPGSAPSPEMRARMDSVRAEMEGFQAEADQYVAAIRDLLKPDQQTKFDALPKPRLTRGGPPRQ
jgi:cytochrome c556